MSDVIEYDYRLIPIISRFGISFGFGSLTVAEVCQRYNIHTFFFLEIANSFSNPDYFPKEELLEFEASLMIDYLVKTHKFYREVKVPEIEGLINSMDSGQPDATTKHVQLLKAFFSEYKSELFHHFQQEEDCVFPYIFELEDAVKNNLHSEALEERISSYPIEDFESTHDDVEEKLSDLKNLIIRHLPPVFCQSRCQKLLIELYRFEIDIRNHSSLEDKVLIPKVKHLEAKYTKHFVH